MDELEDVERLLEVRDKKHSGGAIVAIIIVVLLLVAAMVGSVYGYNLMFGSRTEYEATGNATVFDDLSGVKREAVTFRSNSAELSGYIYSSTLVGDAANNTVSPAVEPKAMLVFSHGLGGTHQWGGYLREFEYFISKGYSVFAYDNTGCGISAGESKLGVSQAVIDLDHALTFIESKQDLPIVLYGHSWGGFAVSSVLNTEHEIAAVVERSGFNKNSEVVLVYGKEMVGDFMYVAAPFISLYERIAFGKYAGYTAVGGINKAQIPVLILQSKDDVQVPFDISIANTATEITNPQAKIHVFENKAHSITMSDEGVVYRAEREKMWNELVGEDIPQLDGNNDDYDYSKTEQMDMDVMNEITGFFDAAILIN